MNMILPFLKTAGRVCLMGIFASAAQAQSDAQDMVMDSSIQDALLFLQAETEVVTVSRISESIRRSTGSVTVIERQDIIKMGARDLTDVLRSVPGIGISQNSIGASRIESRGIMTTLSEKVLLMIDGHVVNSNLVNGGAIGYFDLAIDNVQRIEVVRGPSSALYGTDALIAVVNVITLNAEQMDGNRLSAILADDNTHQFNAQLGHTSTQAGIALNINYFDTDGYPTTIEKDANGRSGIAEFPEQKLDLHLKGNYQDLAFKAHYVDSERGGFLNFADTLANDSWQKYRSWFLDAAYEYHWSDNLSLTPRLYYDLFHFDNYFENFGARFSSDSIKSGAELQIHYDGFADHAIIGGLQYEHQQHENVKTWVGNPKDGFSDVSDIANFNKETSRSLTAIYAEDLWDISDELRFSIGGRYDHYSDFGGNFSPRVSASWLFSPDYDVRLLYGEAFRAPSFADQFNANQSVLPGNRDLKSEQIKTLELGFGVRLREFGTLRFTAFNNRLQDIIVSVPGEPPDNSGEHHVSGLEIEGRFHFEPGISIRANYTYQDAKNTDDDSTLPDVPRHKGNILLDYRFAQHYNLNLHLFMKGKTPRAKTDPRPDNAAYTTLDMTLSSDHLIPGIDGLEGRLSIYNLFDEDYNAPSSIGVTDYPQPGRTLHGQLTYRF